MSDDITRIGVVGAGNTLFAPQTSLDGGRICRANRRCDYPCFRLDSDGIRGELEGAHVLFGRG